MSKFCFIAVILSFLLSINVFAQTDQYDAEEVTDWCERDCSMEYNFFRRYARQGSPLASLSMAIMNYRGHGREVNIEAGNQLLLKAARLEEPVAMYQLGYFLLYGIFFEQDIERALVWFKRSAQFKIGNSAQMVELTTKLLEDEDKPFTDSVKTILEVSDEAAPGLYDQVANNSKGQKVERISVVQSFDWTHALIIAKQQTCKINCPQMWGYMLFPRIKSINEEAVLAAIAQ